jgi:hypothetical protein
MDNTVKFCLELSSEGEEHLLEELRPYPRYRNAILNPGEIYRANGSVLRIWEKMDASEDSPILNFIYEALETLSPDHYRYVLISPHGDGRCDGAYEGPHHLRLVHLPDVEYDPDGNHVPEPQAPPAYNGGPNVFCEQVCSFQVDGAVARDPEALCLELQDMSRDVRLGFVENTTDGYLGEIVDIAENYPEKDIRIRVFVRVEPASKAISGA